MRADAETIQVRVELRAEGADGRLCSTTLCRFRLV